MAAVDEESSDGSGSVTLRRMARAKNYNEWLFARSEPFLGSRVLDVGAGLGTFTERVAREREFVAALEPDPSYQLELEQRFRSTSNVRVVHGDAASLVPAQLGHEFDSILCFNVLEHIRDDHHALARFHDHLRRDGRLLLLVPAHPFLFGEIDRTVLHERRYQKRVLHNLLDATGFEAEEVEYVNPIGAVGWLLAGRVLRRKEVPAAPLAAFDRAVPLIRRLDGLRLPFGLSLWAVARRRG